MNQVYRVPFLQLPRFQKLMDESMRLHSLSPDVNPDSHLRQLHSSLESELLGKTKLYLDTNHWVNLRKARLGKPGVPAAYIAFDQQLTKLCQQGQIVCPLHNTIIEELMGQSDVKMRSHSARIMDEFSGGVCLRNWLEISRIEMHQHVHRVLFPTEVPSDPLFTKIGYFAGVKFPIAKGLSDTTATALSKVHADIFWNMTSDDLQSWPGWLPLPENLIQQMLEIAAAEKKVMQRDNVSFSETRKAALAGWFGPLYSDLSTKFPEWCPELLTYKSSRMSAFSSKCLVLIDTRAGARIPGSKKADRFGSAPSRA